MLRNAQAQTKAEKQRVNKYYCEASLKRRVALLADPEVQNALEGVWQATDRDRSNHVNTEPSTWSCIASLSSPSTRQWLQSSLFSGRRLDTRQRQGRAGIRPLLSLLV